MGLPSARGLNKSPIISIAAVSASGFLRTMNERQVTVTGGSPWGMRLTGGKDFGSPLMVSKVSREVGG